MMTGTTVIRSATGMVVGSVLLVMVAIVPAGALYLTDSLVVSVACLAVAIVAGLMIYTLMTAQRLAYGPGGVYVVADDAVHTLAWNNIEKFDFDKWWAGADDFVRGMVIRLKNGRDVKVDWINTKRTIRRLNEALARFGDRETVPEISAKPTTELRRLTALGLLSAFNIGATRLMRYWPGVFLIAIMVNILAVCIYMGVKMSKGQ